MEKVVEKYRLLVGVEIVHDSFNTTTDRTAHWLRVEPTVPTQKVMRKYHLLFRWFQRGFGLAAQTKNGVADPIPLFDLSGHSLAFRLGFASGTAPARTALATHAGTRYRFGNTRAQAAGQGGGALSLNVPARVNGQTYLPGEIVEEGGKNLVALPDFSVSPPSVSWKEIPAAGYVSAADEEPLTNPAELGLERSDWGLLTLDINNSLGSTYSLIWGGKLNSPTFHLHFGKT